MFYLLASPVLIVLCHSFSLFRIDHKVSSTSYGYKQHEAQAILKEVRTIKDAISCGEREKQELMQVTVALYSDLNRSRHYPQVN